MRVSGSDELANEIEKEQKQDYNNFYNHVSVDSKIAHQRVCRFRMASKSNEVCWIHGTCYSVYSSLLEYAGDLTDSHFKISEHRLSDVLPNPSSNCLSPGLAQRRPPASSLTKDERRLERRW